MTIKNLFLSVGLLVSTVPMALAQSNVPAAIFPGTDAQNSKLVWPQTPGLRYEVQQSTNLQTWITAPGYPAPAFGPAQQMGFSVTNPVTFFKVKELDEQPPVVASQYPIDGDFAVPRFSSLSFQLSDATGINTNSIRLTVGSLGTFVINSTNLFYTNSLLTFINGGSVALGGWGSNIVVTLVMADTLGYAITNSTAFTLEVQPQVVTNLFVFGSPQAQRTGQQVGNIPTRVLAQRSGPIPMAAGDPWTLALVASNRLELTYTNNVPGFTAGQYVCNLTPASPEEIFNRQITNIVNDVGNKRLTLYTVEVPLTEIATNGSVSISANSVILQTGTNGSFSKAFEVGGTITFPRIGYSLDGSSFKLKDAGDFEIVNLTLDEMHWWLTPRLQVGLEVNYGHLKHFEAIASGNVDAATVFDASFLLAGASVETTIFDLPKPLEPKTWMLLGSIGVVPVYASLGFDAKVKARAEVNSTLYFKAGMRQTIDASFGASYTDATGVQWVNTFHFPPPEEIPFTGNFTVAGTVGVSFEPALNFLIYGAAGISAGITPSTDVTFEIGTSQPLSGKWNVDVSLDLGLAGPLFEALNYQPEYSLSLWHYDRHLFPNDPDIAFTSQPQSQTVTFGGSAYFYCTVSVDGTPGYQWYYNGIPMVGQTARTLFLPSVKLGDAGSYSVRVTVDNQITNSASANLTVLPVSVQSGKSGLIAWYPFNGNSAEATGNGSSALVINALLTTDRFGAPTSAFNFNGTNSYLDILQNTTLNKLTTNFTVSAWIYQREVNPEFGYRIIDKCPASIAGGWTFDTWDGVTGRKLRIQGVANNSGNVMGNTVYSLNQWHHVVAVVSGTTGQVYLDGNLDGTGDVGNIPTNALDIFVGRAIPSGPDRAENEYFNGKIDDVRIYNRALSGSEILALYNASLPVAAPSSGMVLIPAGSFTMGGSLDGSVSALPLHSVFVSAFYMDQYDVTYALWQTVYNWATNHGYSFDNTGLGKAANHPVQTVTWYDCVKWCNARSEMEGKTPAYYTSSTQTTVYRTGLMDVDNNSVKWNSGYRLPTEAEWEKAARGGLNGQRFPWGNTINEILANYHDSVSGYNVNFATGDTPYTSPVGYFAPNGYGLYDMAGNVEQWCWDWYDGQWYQNPDSTLPDTRGPANVASQLIYHCQRGGSWLLSTNPCKCEFRNFAVAARSDRGFRTVLTPRQ